MAESFQEKSEKPTEKKLEEAKKKGQVIRSPELGSCMIILFSSIFLYFSMSYTFQEAFKSYVVSVQTMHTDVNVASIHGILSSGIFKWLALVLPLFGLVTFLSIAGTVAQVGFMWSPQVFNFNPNTLNPIAGIGRFVSVRSLQEVLKSLAKIFVLVYISYSIIKSEFPTILSLVQKDVKFTVGYLGQTGFRLALKLGIIFMFLAGIDYLYQRWQFMRNMRMTKQEVTEEMKEREGNPLIKSRIRSLQREFARRRMLEDAKKADVVVTNPTSFAVALKYMVKEMPAPQVVAKGAGFVADKIKTVAILHGVPIVENKPLARGIFYSVKIGDYIPEKFYLVVAELLAQIYRRKSKVGL
ncbi:MAG TPA: flagellar biosynthesis protein FlhB [Syntrophorhabdales bacterium]|nr:flagellar biosynthesis protein FlhB [Syntrophorhabdales bacterium]